ncbi:hypothetical protein SY94_3027 [Agrobacterium tumefaciens]|nr:hypothetical protein SY94_3027 [Agrobacterium tumefaciens]
MANPTSDMAVVVLSRSVCEEGQQVPLLNTKACLGA